MSVDDYVCVCRWLCVCVSMIMCVCVDDYVCVCVCVWMIMCVCVWMIMCVLQSELFNMRSYWPPLGICSRTLI